MRRNSLFENKDGISLNKGVKNSILEWLQYHLNNEEDSWTSDLEDILLPYKLCKKDWFRAAESTYFYLKSLPQIIDNSYQVAFFITLKPSLIINTPPDSLILEDSIRQYEGPNFDIMRGTKEEIVADYINFGYKRIYIKHPFDDSLSVYYGELYSEDYYDSESKVYAESPSYARYLMFI